MNSEKLGIGLKLINSVKRFPLLRILNYERFAMFTVFFFKIEQWKAESNNSERQRQRMEAAYMNLQVQK